MFSTTMEREQQHRIPIDGPRWHRKWPRRRCFEAGCRCCYSCSSHQDAMGTKPKRHPCSSLQLRSSKPPLPPLYRQQPRSRASPLLLLLPRFVATWCVMFVGPITILSLLEFYVQFSWQSPEKKNFFVLSKELHYEPSSNSEKLFPKTSKNNRSSE